MSHGLVLVLVPSLWREPSESDFEAARARFLSGSDDDQYMFDEKHQDDSDESPF